MTEHTSSENSDGATSRDATPPTSNRARPRRDVAKPVTGPRPAPRAVGEIVDGDPPVPIALWHLPAAQAGTIVSTALSQRLRANYAHHRAPVRDLTVHPDLIPKSASRSRSGLARAALVITTWPRDDAAHPRPRPRRSPMLVAGEHGAAVEHLTWCSDLLRRGGYLAVVVAPTDIVDQLGALVTAARGAGLTYLQHIVVAHQLGADDTETRRRARRPTPGHSRVIRHLRVHTDVLMLSKPRDADA